jgi:hypothetical protein
MQMGHRRANEDLPRFERAAVMRNRPRGSRARARLGRSVDCLLGGGNSVAVPQRPRCASESPPGSTASKTFPSHGTRFAPFGQSRSPFARSGALGPLRATRDIAFYLGMGSLFTHELDAVPNHEWRGLPLLQSLPDESAMVVFIAAHVPLFAVLIALVASSNEFSSTLSSLLIFGGSAFGALYLVLEAKAKVAARREDRFAPRSLSNRGHE